MSHATGARKNLHKAAMKARAGARLSLAPLRYFRCFRCLVMRGL